MTAQEMKSLLGQHVFLEPASGLQFRCRITNVKTSYGRPRVEIEAIEGEGKAWVAYESVKHCYPQLAHRPDLASKAQCYLCGKLIGDAEYLANEDNTARHFACPKGGRS